MAAGGRNSPIDWEAERRLQEKGYTFEDTDEGAAFLELISRNPGLELTDDDFLNPVDPSVRSDFEREIMAESFKGLSVEADPTPSRPAQEKRPMKRPSLPGTPTTKEKNFSAFQPVFLSKPRHVKKSRERDVFHHTEPDEDEDSDDNGREEEEMIQPPAIYWKDSASSSQNPALMKAMERKREEEERKRAARAASAAYGSDPDERSMPFKDGNVRATVWKSTPLPLQTDHTCRDRTAGSPQESRMKSVLREARDHDVRMLKKEPRPGQGIIRVGVTLPSGKRVQRHFYDHDTLKVLRAFIWSHAEVPDNIELYTSFPRRKLDINSTTLQEANLANEMIHVVAVK